MEMKELYTKKNNGLLGDQMDVNLESLKKHEEWNESYYFNFHDTNNDLTAFMRIGNKINKNEKSMFEYKFI